MKQECQRCDKEIEVKNIPKMFCPKCVDEIINFNKTEAKKEVLDDLDEMITDKIKKENKFIGYQSIVKLKKRHLSTSQKDTQPKCNHVGGI